jgi:hypothetical protein
MYHAHQMRNACRNLIGRPHGNRTIEDMEVKMEE